MSETIKVVVTDDDPQILLLTSTILRRAGYEVLETSTGKQGLEAVRTHRPDIVLLDVVLPDMTGIEVCRQIKADESIQRTFVILMSGIQISSEYQAEGLSSGAEGYITKPISNKELLARVQSLVRIKRAEETLREKEKEQQSTEHSRSRSRSKIRLATRLSMNRRDSGALDVQEPRQIDLAVACEVDPAPASLLTELRQPRRYERRCENGDGRVFGRRCLSLVSPGCECSRADIAFCMHIEACSGPVGGSDLDYRVGRRGNWRSRKRDRPFRL